MIWRTASGASSGGSATPLERAVAFVVLLPLTPASTPDALRPPELAGPVGFGAGSSSPGSCSGSGASAPVAPASGCTTRARSFFGSGGSFAVLSCASEIFLPVWVFTGPAFGAAFGSPVAPIARYPPPIRAAPSRHASRAVRRIHRVWREITCLWIIPQSIGLRADGLSDASDRLAQADRPGEVRDQVGRV